MEFLDKHVGCYNPFYRKIDLVTQNRTIWVACPCGKCINCLRKYEKDWSFRMREEMAKSRSSFFLTITYNDENLPFVGKLPSLKKSDYQGFLKRVRKRLSRIDRDITLRYVVCGEYGGETNRPHYHFAIFFNQRVPFNVFYKICNDSWNKGFIQLKFLDSDKIHYLSKYFNKLDPRWHNVEIFRNMSVGIGKGFLTPKVVSYYRKKRTTVVHRFGVTRSMPRYYKDKIFNRYAKEVILLDSQHDYDNWLRLFYAVHGFVDPHSHYMHNNLDALKKAQISFVSVTNDDVIENI